MLTIELARRLHAWDYVMDKNRKWYRVSSEPHTWKRRPGYFEVHIRYAGIGPKVLITPDNVDDYYTEAEAVALTDEMPPRELSASDRHHRKSIYLQQELDDFHRDKPDPFKKFRLW